MAKHIVYVPRAMECGSCYWFSTSWCSGACENPKSKKCGEYVALFDYCNKWTKKEEERKDNETD